MLPRGMLVVHKPKSAAIEGCHRHGWAGCGPGRSGSFGGSGTTIGRRGGGMVARRAAQGHAGCVSASTGSRHAVLDGDGRAPRGWCSGHARRRTGRRAVSDSTLHTGSTSEMQGQRRRAVVASTVGTTIEWYDFFLYGTAAALVFPKVFFPGAVPVRRGAGLVRHPVRRVRAPGRSAPRSSATTATGSAARPRSITTLLLMGIATFLIGVLPGYARHRHRRADPADRAAASCRASASAASGAARC